MKIRLPSTTFIKWTCNKMYCFFQVVDGDDLPAGKYELVGLFNVQGQEQVLQQTDYNPRKGIPETASDDKRVQYLRPPGSLFDSQSQQQTTHTSSRRFDSTERESGPLGPLDLFENLGPRFAPGTNPNSNSRNKRPRRQQVSSLRTVPGASRYPQFTPYNPYSAQHNPYRPADPKPDPDYTKPPYQAPEHTKSTHPVLYGPTRPAAYPPRPVRLSPYGQPDLRPYSKPFVIRPTTTASPPSNPTPTAFTFTRPTPDYDDHLPYQHTYNAYSKHVTPTPKPYGQSKNPAYQDDTPETYSPPEPAEPAYREPSKGYQPLQYKRPASPTYQHELAYKRPDLPPYHKPKAPPPAYEKPKGPYRPPKATYAEESLYKPYKGPKPAYAPEVPTLEYNPTPEPYHPNTQSFTPQPSTYTTEPPPVYSPKPPTPYTPKLPIFNSNPPVYTPQSPYSPQPPAYTPKPPVYTPNSPVSIVTTPLPAHTPTSQPYEPPAPGSKEEPQQKYKHFPVVNAVPAVPPTTTAAPRAPAYEPTPRPYEPIPKEHEVTRKPYGPTPKPYKPEPSPFDGPPNSNGVLSRPYTPEPQYDEPTTTTK